MNLEHAVYQFSRRACPREEPVAGLRFDRFVIPAQAGIQHKMPALADKIKKY
jgi:hypothetical protein